MSTIITLKTGVIALLGDNSITQWKIKDLVKTIDLKIQYNEHPIQPIQIQIDNDNWNDNIKFKDSTEIDKQKYYIKLLQDLETAYGGRLFDCNGELLLF